jgi:ribonuclease BN (tRNA processing enzyme)
MGNFSLTVLGAGTMVPTKERGPAGFLIKVSGKKFLVDAGHGVIRRMVDFGLNLQDIDYIFISHFHTDHFGDAFNLIHTRWVDDTYKGNAHKKLIFFCPKGTKERFKLWRKIYWVEPGEQYPLEFLEGPRKIKLDKIQLEIFPVNHVKWFSSVGIVIKFDGKKIVYTGDMGSSHDFNQLVKIVKKANLLITEASYENPTPNHYTVEQIKKLSNKSKVSKVLVVHVRPQHEERVREVCKKEQRFIFGKDGLKIEI